MNKNVFLHILTFIVFFIPFNSSALAFVIPDSLYRKILRQGYENVTCYLSYPVNSSEIDIYYRNNLKELIRLDEFLNEKRMLAEFIGNFTITAYSSVEGGYDANERLAKARAFSFEDYLKNTYPAFHNASIHINWVAEDWPGLTELIKASDFSYKNDIINLFNNVGIVAGREKQLKKLSKGIPYQYIRQEFLPLLRRVELRIVYDLKRLMEVYLNQPIPANDFTNTLLQERNRLSQDTLTYGKTRVRDLEPVNEQHPDSSAQAVHTGDLYMQDLNTASSPHISNLADAESRTTPIYNLTTREYRQFIRNKKERPVPVFALKTDLLLLCGVAPDFKLTTYMPNLAAELYLGRRWSIEFFGAYANWRGISDQHQHWGISSYGLSPHIWLKGDRSFRGIHFGLYGYMGEYNQKKLNGTTHLGDNYTGSYWETGISAGYVQSLSRHWCLEAQVRGGYRRSRRDVYDVISGVHYYNASLEATGKIIPTVKVNIIYRINTKQK